MIIIEYIKNNEFINNFFKGEEVYIKDLTNGINEVYLLESKNKDLQVILKKALPYFKQYGPEHPLDKCRILFESKALEIFKSNNNDNFVPNLYYVDEKESLILIEYIKDKISLNEFLQRGIVNKNFSEQISTFLSNNFIKTSLFNSNQEERKNLLNTFSGNNQMKELSIQFIFTDLIDRYTKLIQGNKKTNELFTDLNSQNNLLLENIENLKNKFKQKEECLIHGDLKGASILLNENEFYVIDYEFSSFGPMGYELSSIIYVFVSLIINYDLAKCDKEYISWMINTIEELWYKFNKKSSLLNTKFNDETSIDLLKDTVGFMGTQMLSMMIPHVVPFNSNNIKIENENIYYKRISLIGKIFINKHSDFTSIEQVIKVIKSHLQYY